MSHNCDVFVLSCIDFRFWKDLHVFLESKGIEVCDFSALAGGAKNVIDKDTRAVIFKQLEIFIKKHEGTIVYLVNHIDCGAYGGSAAFESIEVERKKMIDDLKQARTIIKKKFPELKINLLLHTWEDVEEV